MMVRQDQGQVKVMGEEGMEMMVDISNIKSADIPLEALNKSKEDMIKSFHLHHGEQTDDVHLPHGEGGKAPSQQVSPVKHLPVTKILDVKEDIHAKDSEVLKRCLSTSAIFMILNQLQHVVFLRPQLLLEPGQCLPPQPP